MDFDNRIVHGFFFGIGLAGAYLLYLAITWIVTRGRK